MENAGPWQCPVNIMSRGEGEGLKNADEEGSHQKMWCCAGHLNLQL